MHDGNENGDREADFEESAEEAEDFENHIDGDGGKKGADNRNGRNHFKHGWTPKKEGAKLIFCITFAALVAKAM